MFFNRVNGKSQIILVDQEKMKIGNLTRHTLALDCIGRLKIKALQERLVSISPYVKYYTSDVPGKMVEPGNWLNG